MRELLQDIMILVSHIQRLNQKNHDSQCLTKETHLCLTLSSMNVINKKQFRSAWNLFEQS